MTTNETSAKLVRGMAVAAGMASTAMAIPLFVPPLPETFFSVSQSHRTLLQVTIDRSLFSLF